jgi:hypothetical protein
LLSEEAAEDGGAEHSERSDPPGHARTRCGRGLLGVVVGAFRRVGDADGLLVLLGLGLGLGGRGGRSRRGCGRLGPEHLVGERDLVDGVDGERELLTERGAEQHGVDAGGHVDVVAGALDVVLVGPVAAGPLRAHLPVEAAEHGQAVEARQHAVEHQLDLVLVRQRVQRAGLEPVEGRVRGRQHRQPVVAVCQLRLHLVVHAGVVQQLQELAVLPRVPAQRLRQVRRRRGRVRRVVAAVSRTGRCLRLLLRRAERRRCGQERQHDGEAGGHGARAVGLIDG